MVNPNLHAGYPVLFAIRGVEGGHAIICDGYGYNPYPFLYHHLNMGWFGSDNLWYNLPNIDSSPAYTTITGCVYNIFFSGSGEIIAGRVTGANGDPNSPIDLAQVTATGGGITNQTIAHNGIYAIPKLPSNTPFTISVGKDGYTFLPQQMFRIQRQSPSLMGPMSTQVIII